MRERDRFALIFAVLFIKEKYERKWSCQVKKQKIDRFILIFAVLYYQEKVQNKN